MIRIFLPLVLILLLSPRVLWAGAEEDANRLFVLSVQMYRASTGEIDAARRVDLLTAAREKLDKVTRNFRNTRIARELAKGEPIGNFAVGNLERDLQVAEKLLPGSGAHGLCPREFSSECLIDWALGIGRGIETADTREWVLEYMARALARTGRVSYATDLANFEIRSTLYQGAALALIATVLANDGNISDALELAGDIENADYRSRALGGISVAQANFGRFDEALDLLSRIEKSKGRDHATGRIAVAFAQKARFEKALDMAGAIDTESIAAWTLGDIALELTKAGKEEMAATIFEKARGLALRAAATGGGTSGLIEVVASLADSGLFPDAVILAQEIENEFTALWALMEIADAHARANRFDEARRVLPTARGNFFQARGLANIAKLQHLAGLRNKAAATFKQSLEYARGEEKTRLRGWVLGEIAAALVVAGREADANRIFTEALIVLQTNKSKLKRAMSLVDVLAALAP